LRSIVTAVACRRAAVPLPLLTTATQVDAGDNGEVESCVVVNVLGELEVRRGESVVPIVGLKRRQLFAVLVAARGAAVSLDRLGEALWEDAPPDSARATLQSHVSRLRSALAPDPLLRSSGTGYAIDVDLVELDAARFESLIGAAAGGDDKISALERALELWRGQAFGEFAELPGVRGEALRLEELRLTATEDLIDARLEYGDEARTVAELESLVAAHPLRDKFWRQLMLALHRTGRQAEALRRCAELRSMLRDQMGLSLSPAVLALEAQILANDASLLRPSSSAMRAPRAALPHREPTRLIGRADDIAVVRTALDARPVVTVCGPGGVGKTRLAMTVASACAGQFAQVAVVELAFVRDADATVPLIACALDVEQRQHLTLAQTIEEFIQDRAVLLVLDNCEHLLDAVVPLVQRLCRRCPNLTVLATGREPLGVAGEYVHPLAPLGVPAAGAGDEARSAAAVELFAERAAEARPGFTLDERNLAPVAEICRRLDGLPLAIELAAARMRSIGVEALADRLDRRFSLLSGSRAGADPRHRSLHALFEWSYELLDPVDQEAFSHLSAFAGSFDLDAADAVCRPAGSAEGSSARVVFDLVDKSMVHLVDPEEPRYRLLETLRGFGQERLRHAGSLAPVEERHRQWFLHAAERDEIGLDTADEGRWAAGIDRDLDNFRAAHASAVRSGDVATAAGLVAALREYSFRRVRYEIAGWGEATMHMDGFERAAAAPVVLGVAAYGHWVRGDLDAAITLGRRSVAIGKELGVPSTGLAERVLANALFYSGETQEALQSMERMIVAAEASGSPAALAHALYMTSVAETSVGKTERGATLAERAAVAADRCGSPTARAQAAYASGMALRASDSEQAERALRLAADLGEEGGNRWIRAFALTEVHWLAAQQGRVTDGLRGFTEVIDVWYRGGDWANQWLSMRHVLGIFADLGAHRAAAVLHGALVAAGAAAALPFEPGDAKQLAAEANRAREVLGPAEFAGAVRSGAAMSDADTVAYVQSELDRLLGEQANGERSQP
jgi:predicted ATPase/DNA-binding SARP family transcriptional activator